MWWWIGMLIVSPLWGTVSTGLFLMTWLACLNVIIGAIGFVAGRVKRKATAAMIGTGIGTGIVCSLLLHGGGWLLTDVLNFGWSREENTVYWVCAAFAALYMLPQIPGRLKTSWNHAMHPGSLEGAIFARKIGELGAKLRTMYQTMTALFLPLSFGLFALVVTASLAFAQAARPVDTVQFGLLDRGMATAEVRARLGSPAHVKTDTRTVLVPLRSRHDWGHDRRRAPAYGVRTTEYEWWYYPEGGGSMATVLEFRDGELYAKDKYR